MMNKIKRLFVNVNDDGIVEYLLQQGYNSTQLEWLLGRISGRIRQERYDTTILMYDDQDFTDIANVNLFMKQLTKQGLQFLHDTYASEIFTFDDSNDAHFASILKTPNQTLHVSKVKQYLDSLE